MILILIKGSVIIFRYLIHCILRVIVGLKPREHSAPLFKELNILSIFQINVYVIGKFMYKVYHQKTLSVFISMFKLNSSIHNHNTRQANQFHLPQANKNLRKTSLSYRGAIIWNKILSLGIRINVSDAVFSKDFKKFITDTVCHF